MPKRKRARIGRRTCDTNMVRSHRRSQREENPTREERVQNPSVNQQPRNRARPVGVNALRQTERAAFNYNSATDYSMHAYIGVMGEICQYCQAEKFIGETDGMCCAGGKVKLPALAAPPDPLRRLLTDMSPTSKHFLQHIQSYNSCFQMTSFGATKIIRDNFMPTFKVITLCGMINTA